MPGAPPRPPIPGPLSSPPPRLSLPQPPDPLFSPPPLRGCTLARCDRVPWPGSRARVARGSVRRAQTAASSDRRRARADQTGGRRSARPTERARSRRGARGAQRPGRREGRWLGGAGRRAEPIRAPWGRGFPRARPPELVRVAGSCLGPRAEPGLRRPCSHEVAVPPARAPRALPPLVGWA